MINFLDEPLGLDRIGIFIKNTKFSPFANIIDRFVKEFGKYHYKDYSSTTSPLQSGYKFLNGMLYVKTTKYNTTLINTSFNRKIIKNILKALNDTATKIIEGNKVTELKYLNKCELGGNICLPNMKYEQVEKKLVKLCEAIIPVSGRGGLAIIKDGETFGKCKNGDCNGKKTFYIYPYGKNKNGGKYIKKKSKKPNTFFKVYCKKINGVWHIRIEITLSLQCLIDKCGGKRLSIIDTIETLLKNKVKDFWQFGKSNISSFIKKAKHKLNLNFLSFFKINNLLKTPYLCEQIQYMRWMADVVGDRYLASLIKKKYITIYDNNQLCKVLGV